MSRPLYLYAIVGVVLLLSRAVSRLAPLAWAPIADGSLTTIHWVVAVPWVGFMVWTEGVKGFHQRFCPRVVARASRLADAPLYARVLAPPAAIGLLWATRRRRVASWMLVAGIVLLVALVHRLPATWRGILDLGVVAGLTTGTLSLLWHAARGWRGHLPEVDPQLP